MAYSLLTQRLSIQPLTESDLPTFINYRQDPEVARFQSWDTSYSANQALELLNSQANVQLPSSGNWLQLAVHDRNTGELLGDLALHSLATEHSAFEIGFTFAKANQGKGFAKEAVSRLLKYLFDEIRATVIEANCDRRNSSAIKLLTSIGFKNQPEKSWTEHFKNELITMDHFELNSISYYS